jgi:ATP-binding cassette subfamily A (ABC1) protein 3
MNKVKPRDDLELDDDVLAEEKRVEETSPQDMRVRVNKFRKVYTNMTGNSLVAVEKTSFGLDYGECFALLGVNGAGKSTTFKSLTYDIEPTAGELTINGLEVKSNFSTVRKQIGYCP